jgi:Putative nucleotidyltransferase DUF294
MPVAAVGSVPSSAWHGLWDPCRQLGSLESVNAALRERRAYAEERLEALRRESVSLLEVIDDEPLCVYVTGSYGRLEAWEESDLDVFFLDARAQDADRLPWITMVRLCAGLADSIEALGFPPFSGGGEWLEVQYVDEMESVLGSPRDDSINSFTARMLLLLESRPLLKDDLYEQLVERSIGFYFRDYADYPDDFVPVFLTNDILRFWRTLTLNYEHDRYEVRQLPEDEQVRAKASSALKNYKLKFSRLTTCFSMVSNLVAIGPPVKPDDVVRLTRFTPLDRLEWLGSTSEEAGRLVQEIGVSYAAFLENVQRPKGEILEELGPREHRRQLLADASSYGELIYRLLRAVAAEDRIRHLIV